LRQIYEGKFNAITAAAKANYLEKAPLDWRFSNNKKITPDTIARFNYLGMHFFNRNNPEKVLLDEEHSRVVHGGHVIGLYYATGFRSAWYMLKKGETLNQEGDTNPFHQAMIFIEGEGFAKIGDKTVKVKKGESYYIPPNTSHVVWTESDEPLVLIWLAWGKGA